MFENCELNPSIMNVHQLYVIEVVKIINAFHSISSRSGIDEIRTGILTITTKSQSSIWIATRIEREKRAITKTFLKQIVVTYCSLKGKS